MNTKLLLSCCVVALLLASCTRSELEIPANHPGHPAARQGRPFESTALSSRYDVQLEAVEGTSGEHAHEGHTHDTAGADDASKAGYTCPMHPEVVSKEPGSCPICGMKLVPRGEKQP